MPMSSSAAFCCTLCQMASIVSATMASYANGDRADNVALCQRLLDGRDTGACEPADNRSKGVRPLTTDFAICPDCGGTLRQLAAVPRSCNPQPFSCDTSCLFRCPLQSSCSDHPPPTA